MPHPVILDFERPIVELERKIEELQGISGGSADLAAEIERLETRARSAREKVYSKLTPWQRVQLARHPARPRPYRVLSELVEEFTELHGDRESGDDPGVIAGLGYCDRRPVAALALGRGRRLSGAQRWIALPRRSGLRKAARVAEMADRFGLPLILLVDGADDGITVEQSEGVHHVQDPSLGPSSAALMSQLGELSTPSVGVILGEAYGSVAMAFTIVDRLLMLEHAVCAPVTPETCSVTEYGDADHVEAAAAALRLTAEDAKVIGFCEKVIAEPPGGGHRDPDAFVSTLCVAVGRELTALGNVAPEVRKELRQSRRSALTRLVLSGE